VLHRSVISNVSDGSQKPQGQLRQQPSPIEVASRAIHIKARKKVAVTKPVRPSLPHDQQPADHENDGSQKPHEDVNNPFLVCIGFHHSLAFDVSRPGVI